MISTVAEGARRYPVRLPLERKRAPFPPPPNASHTFTKIFLRYITHTGIKQTAV
jgi:hypothetical protein